MPRGAPRVVLDLNVLVSGLLAERSHRSTAPARCLAAARGGAIQLVLSPAMLDRLRRALAYSKLGFSGETADQVSLEIVEWCKSTGLAPDPRPAQPHELLCPDPEDDAILRTALAGGADVLVSGDAHLLKRLTPLGARLATKVGLDIVTPQVFVAARL